MRPTFFIIAGEVSGDKHAADLVKSLHALLPEARFTGIGGEYMQQAGVQLLYHISQFAVLGITEIIRHLPFLRRVLGKVKSVLRREADAVILIDYPGFNLRVAKLAKQMGLPVIYYICPQLWAWGGKRVEKIRKYVDLPLVIFHFEELFYRRHGIHARFVGHPIVEQLYVEESEAAFREKHHLPAETRIVGLFPGSRQMEVDKLLPVMLDSVQRLRESIECIPVIGAASHLPLEIYEKHLPREGYYHLIQSDIHALMKYSYAALVASGTATLELGFLETPMVVMYAVSPITYWMGRALIKIDTIALANIVLQGRVVPELIQHEMKAENVYHELLKYFTDREYYRAVQTQLTRIKEELGNPGASRRAAESIVHFLQGMKIS